MVYEFSKAFFDSYSVYIEAENEEEAKKKAEAIPIEEWKLSLRQPKWYIGYHLHTRNQELRKSIPIQNIEELKKLKDDGVYIESIYLKHPDYFDND